MSVTVTGSGSADEVSINRVMVKSRDLSKWSSVHSYIFGPNCYIAFELVVGEHQDETSTWLRQQYYGRFTFNDVFTITI